MPRKRSRGPGGAFASQTPETDESPAYNSRDYWKERALAAERIVNDVVINVTNYQIEERNHVSEYELKKIREFCEGENVDVLRHGISQNHSLHLMISRMTVNKYNVRRYADSLEDGKQHVEDREFKRDTQLSFVTAVIARLRSAHNSSLDNLVTAVVLLRSGMANKSWRILCALKVLPDMGKARQIIHHFVQRPLSQPSRGSIGLGIYDNCCYTHKFFYERVGDHKDAKIQTCNFVEVPIGWECQHLEVEGRPVFRNERWDMTQEFKPGGAYARSTESDLWKYVYPAMTKNQEGRRRKAWDYPEVSDEGIHDRVRYELQMTTKVHTCRICILIFLLPSFITHVEAMAPTIFEVFRPLLRVDTGSYEENEDCCWHLWTQMQLRNQLLTHAFVIGDEQTYQRMIFMKLRNPISYSWLIPMHGEFHFAAHMIHCEYRLYWDHFLQLIAAETGKKKIKADHNVSEFNRHELFYLTVVQAVWEFMEDAFGNLMSKPRELLAKVDKSVTGKTLATFLFHGAVPFLALRSLIRRPPTKENRRLLNRLWRLYAWRFKATNKTNYGPLCFYASRIYEGLTDDMQELWASIYCVSLKGHPGRNVGLDHLLEKVNLCAKDLVGNDATEELITARVPEINFVYRCEGTYMAHTTNQSFNEFEAGNPNLDPEVEAIQRWLRIRITEPRAMMTENNNRNRITMEEARGLVRPWEHIARAQEGWEEYARDKLDMFNFAV